LHQQFTSILAELQQQSAPEIVIKHKFSVQIVVWDKDIALQAMTNNYARNKVTETSSWHMKPEQKGCTTHLKIISQKSFHTTIYFQ
jgi:hypothetical protein